MELARVQVRGPLCAGDVVLLLDEAEGHWGAGRQVLCDVHDLCDLGVVDAVARLALASRRHGSWLRVRAAGRDVEQLLELTGLTGVLHLEVRGP